MEANVIKKWLCKNIYKFLHILSIMVNGKELLARKSRLCFWSTVPRDVTENSSRECTVFREGAPLKDWQKKKLAPVPSGGKK